MESKARLKSISRDLMTKEFEVTFSVETLGNLEELHGEDLRLVVKKWKNRRSLDANAYMWVLLTEMASVLRTSKDELYEVMLHKYGIVQETPVTVRSDVNMSTIPGHWHLLKQDSEWAAYLPIRGTSDYDTAEMSTFLDRVVEEAKELGIDTATPEELERIKAYG